MNANVPLFLLNKELFANTFATSVELGEYVIILVKTCCADGMSQSINQLINECSFNNSTLSPVESYLEIQILLRFLFFGEKKQYQLL